MLVIGAVSALLGVMYALMEHDLKSLLAFHSVENIGIILLGIGAGMIFQTYGLREFAALGLLAGLYHTINHAMFKALLFLGAGSLLYATHTRNMEEYGGLLRRMPWTGLFFLIGAVSISALPPTNGFVSEWLVFQSLFLSFQLPGVSETDAPDRRSDAGADRSARLGLLRQGIRHLVPSAATQLPCAAGARKCRCTMRVGMGMLAVSVSLLGLAPMVVVPLLDRVVAPFAGIVDEGKVLALDGWALAPVNVEFSSVSPAGPCAAAWWRFDAWARDRGGLRWSCARSAITRRGGVGST